MTRHGRIHFAFGPLGLVELYDPLTALPATNPELETNIRAREVADVH